MSILQLGNPEWHFWLTRSVARMLGISMSTALDARVLDGDQYRAMVARCRTCQQVRECETWLARQPGHADRPPQGCANAGDFTRLIDAVARPPAAE